MARRGPASRLVTTTGTETANPACTLKSCAARWRVSR